MKICKAALAVLAIPFIFCGENFSQNYQSSKFISEGSEFEKTGQLAEALDSYRKAVKFDSNLVEGYLACGQIFDKMGCADSAQDYYNQAAKIEPSNAMVYYFRGYSHLVAPQQEITDSTHNINRQLATDDFTKAIMLGIHVPEVFYYRAFAYEKLGENSKAISDLKRFLKERLAFDAKLRTLYGDGANIDTRTVDNAQATIEKLESEIAQAANTSTGQ